MNIGANLSVVAARQIAKSPASAWDLLVWAYRDEQVRFLCGDDDGMPRAPGSILNSIRAALAGGIVTRGHGVTGFTPGAHEDALAIHALVVRLCNRRVTAKRDRDPVLWYEQSGEAARCFWMLVKHAEAGMPPVWDAKVPDLRTEMVKGKRGGPRMLYPDPKRNDISACLVRFVGVTAEQRAAIRQKARDDWRKFHALVSELRTDMAVSMLLLSRWRVSGIGVHPEPWKLPARQGGLTVREKS